jgi:hypothetical protein
MSNLLKILLIPALLLVLCIMPAQAMASNALFNGACSSSNGGIGANTSTLCQSDNVSGSSVKNNPLLGANGLLLKISTIIALIAGIAAVIVTIVAGMRFITSGGDPAKAQGARATLLNALIGVVIIIVAESIIGFVLSKV